MKIIALKENILKISSPSITSLLNAIELNRGKSFSLPKKIKLNRLHDLNRRRSVTSSNEIEGIKIKKSRKNDILLNNLDPSTKEEFMVCGYNKALENVFSVYKYQSLTESYIKDLHYFLYKDLTPEFGGKYKTSQNYIQEFDKNNNSVRTVFIPAKPEEASSLMGNLIYQFEECILDPNCNRLITIFAFVLEFLCIHPFHDGNGRVSRLLTTFLLLKAGYELDEYYSLSYLILNNVDMYYRFLEKSSIGWNENKNDYEPFIYFMLTCLKEGYEKLVYIFEMNSLKISATEKVLCVINESKDLIAKANIEEILINLSRATIEKSLSDLVKEKRIQIVQRGKYAKYFKV